MKPLKYIVFILLLFGVTSLFSQNKRIVNSYPSVMNLPPEPHISWTNACFGDTTCFVNQSIRAYSYTWTIAGDTSLPPFGIQKKITLEKAYNDSILCYHFYKTGTYSITLTCYDNHLDSVTTVITIDTITKASFSFIHCSNVFANTSSCASSFLWNFGDGTSSTLASPIHQYADTGHYNVTLIAYNGMTSDTLKQQIFVNATAFANGGFTYTIAHDTVFVRANYKGPGTDYYWTWGPGSYSTGQDTFHVYKDSTATYLVALNAINLACGPSSGQDTVKIIQLGLPPEPDFYYTNTCLGDTTCFINQSIRGQTYTWTVSDTGSVPHVLYTSNDSNICFRFPAVGLYQVSLLVYGDHYAEETIKIVSIGTVPVAGFSFTHCSNKFQNNSSCATSFYWDFGDSTNSTAIAPIHQYADTGYYNVTLTAYNGIDSNTITQQIHVDITAAANAGFTAISSNDTAWFHADFTFIPATIYKWSFGDGGHATGRDTVHIFADTVKTYYVKLTATNLCGSVSNTDTLKIAVPVPPPDLDFSNSILTIVPNPVSNNGYIDAFFNAYSANNYLTQVYNAIGQKVFEENFAFQPGINEFKISAVGFASGVYIMLMQNGNSYVRQKFYVINKPD